MDVVNSELRQLGGTILIDSFPGAGTTFTLRMPFTVSVNRALMIEVGSDSYGLALKSVSGVTRIPVADLREHYLDPERKFEYAGQSYEVRYLGTLLADELQPVLDITTGQVPLVLIRAEEHNYAVHVDGLIGSQEVVVKSLGLQFNRVPGLSGASVLGDGRVVVILDLLTLLRDKGQTVTYSEKVASARASQRTQVPTIMVVDDSVTVRKVTSRLLEREGFRVLTAKDGVDAMRLLQESVPDVMLLDIEMPRMDGFEVARLVRSTERLKELPIIMITSRTGDKHRDKAFAIGVNQYLGKPYQEEQLLGHIHQYLASGNRLRNAAAQ
jgi:chemosensory pili system protein ChpA (sensor histidine kinase/response regulator)